ncbi:hypothetical protein GCM10009619_05780 [Williamsia maris]|uniref:Uncharacterized protein n=1 Tax=Williamsia maris TaxID=72806 RepID=A0ABT1H9A3_9NOCA|nr:hypothetical protein [Williamsia maris]
MIDTGVTPQGHTISRDDNTYLGSIPAVPALSRYDSTYEIPDTWETYAALSVLLDELFAYVKSGPRVLPSTARHDATFPEASTRASAWLFGAAPSYR